MTPPNVLYLHSHDTGRYVQPYGHQIPTPNIQMLADQGALFRQAFCAGPTCSGSRAALLTGQYPHSNGMMGLAHRGWRLNDYGEHIIHTLREAGYRSELIGEQHISEDLDTLGYDEVHRVARTNVELVAPEAVRVLREGIPEPWFLSVGFFETHRSLFEPTSPRARPPTASPTRGPFRSTPWARPPPGPRRRPCAAPSTRCRRRPCPTRRSCARPWPPSRQPPARSTRASAAR